MSVSSEVKRPAEFGWPGGDHPGELAFPHRVEPELSAALAAALRPHLGELPEFKIDALTPPLGAIGRFRLTASTGAWFLRVSAKWGEPELEQAISGWLLAAGVPVNHLDHAGVALDFGGVRLRIDVRALVQGRHYDGSLEDLVELSTALARCHEALRSFPRVNRVQELAARRFAHLDAVRESMRAALQRQDWDWFAGDDWAETHRGWLEQLVAEFQPRFDLLVGAQCLHAQVHRANVIFSAAHQPILVDFEEAVQTLAPPSWDLAYFVQRFCLHDEPEEKLRAERFAAVRAAYGAPVAGVAEMMRQTAWFSAVILADYHSRGIVSPRAEYDKFVRLEQQAQKLAAELALLAI